MVPGFVSYFCHLLAVPYWATYVAPKAGFPNHKMGMEQYLPYEEVIYINKVSYIKARHLVYSKHLINAIYYNQQL